MLIILRSISALSSKVILIICFLSLLVLPVKAQEDEQPPPTASASAQNGPEAPPRPTSKTIFDENINLYNGSVRVAVPLLQISGRGNAQTSITTVIQPEVISGSNRYYYNVPLSEFYRINDSSNTYAQLKQYYYNNLMRIGAGYGPGVLYTNFRSFTDPSDATGRRPAHLTFVDPSGTRHVLRDQQIIRLNVTSLPWPTLNSTQYVIDSGQYQYRNVNEAGKVYRAVDDLGMMFISDGVIKVPDANSFDEQAYELEDYPVLPSGMLYMRDGTRLRIDGGYVSWLSDRNGNLLVFKYEHVYYSGTQGRFMRVTQIKDSLNRTVNIHYGDYANPDTITYNGVNGTPETIKVQRKLLQDALQDGNTLKTLLSLYPEYSTWLNPLSNIPYNPEITSSIEYPDGRGYQFKYDSYGELVWVKQPSGASATYKYGAGAVNSLQGGVVHNNHSTLVPDPTDPTGVNTVQGIAEYWLFYRRLIEVDKYLDDQTLVNKTTISRPEIPGGDGCTGCVQVDTLDKDANLLTRQKHYFNDTYSHESLKMEVRAVNDHVLWSAGLEVKTETYNVVNNTPSLATTVENTWTHGPINPTPGVGDWSWWNGDVNQLALVDRARITETKRTLEDTHQVTLKKFSYDEYLNRVDVWEYDYGVGSPGALLRHTHTDYLTESNGIEYDGFHSSGSFKVAGGIQILSLPQKTLVYEGDSTTPISRTEYEYDIYDSDAHHDNLTDRPNISGLCITPNRPGGITTDFAGDCASASNQDYKGRGNLTGVTAYSDAGADTGPISTYTKFDMAGNPVSKLDALGHESKIGYDDDFGQTGLGFSTFAYPTSATTPVPDSTGNNASSVSLGTHSTYDYSSGSLVSSTDTNGQTTSYSYVRTDGTIDPFGRVQRISRPDGGRDDYDYGDDPGNLFIHTKTLLQSTPAELTVESYDRFDNLGRGFMSVSYNGGADPNKLWIAKSTQYDAIGRATAISNPYYVSAPDVSVDAATLTWSKTDYDGLGRVLKVTAPDGAAVTTACSGTKVMVTDQAGRSRLSETDALARVKSVVEFTRVIADPTTVAAPAAGDYQTSYEYDAQDNLQTVSQGGQTRRYTYDSLKRLKTAFNPESGTVSYEYDDNGNLKKKIDARQVQTDYTYDSLNRMISRKYSIVGATMPENYSDTPQVDYFYDGTGMPVDDVTGQPLPTPARSNGRQTAMKSGVSQNVFTEFDLGGRVKTQLQIVDPQSPNPKTYQMEYVYDFAGNMLSEKYPSGRTIVTEYDAAGRIAGVKNGTQSDYYVGAAAGDPNSLQYAPHGAVSDLRLGNGLWEHADFNIRLQPKLMALGTSKGDTGILKIDYTYGVIENGSLNTAKNNGNVQSQTISVPNTTGALSSYTQSFTYDQLNRLSTAQEVASNAVTWAQNFKYDQYGNRTFNTGTLYPSLPPSATDPINNPTISTANNQIDNTVAGQEDYKYDPSGNLIKTPTAAYSYNAENKQVSNGFPNPSSVSYSYDGDGKRIKRVDATTSTVYVYDVNGQMVAEYTDGRIASNGRLYITADPLGSPRVVTDKNKNVQERHDYMPFGESIPAQFRSTAVGYDKDILRQKFTGKERDDETQLDYFQARYYSSAQGRFTSPDEFPGGAAELFTSAAASNPTFFADPMNPQSLNKYQYAYNNPLRFIDPTGHNSVTDYFDLLGQYFLSKAEPEKAAQEDKVDTPFGMMSAEEFAFWSAQTFNNTGMAVGGIFEQAGLDFGVMEETRQMNASMNGKTDVVGLTVATAKMAGNVLALGAGGEAGIAAEGEFASPSIASDGAESISPSSIRFSQSSVNGLEELTTSMKANGWKGDPIDVVKMPDGGLTTVDNTRVLAAHLSGVETRAVVHEASDPLPLQFVDRFTTRKGGSPQTWGDAVLNRINSQNSIFRATYPLGSPYTGVQW